MIAPRPAGLVASLTSPDAKSTGGVILPGKEGSPSWTLVPPSGMAPAGSEVSPGPTAGVDAVSRAGDSPASPNGVALIVYSENKKHMSVTSMMHSLTNTIILSRKLRVLAGQLLQHHRERHPQGCPLLFWDCRLLMIIPFVVFFAGTFWVILRRPVTAVGLSTLTRGPLAPPYRVPITADLHSIPNIVWVLM